MRSVLNFVCGPAKSFGGAADRAQKKPQRTPRQIWRCGVFGAVFLGWHAYSCRGWVLPRKFGKFHNWAKPSPRSNPVMMHRTTTGILRKIREIEASSIGVETLRGYNLDRPPGCNPKTRDHKQSSIFVELADAFSCHSAQADTKFSTKFSTKFCM
jgi:hypothetical protein